MKKLFKAIYYWLDRKFPDMVVVTQKEYEELKNKLKTYDETLAGYSDQRIKEMLVVTQLEQRTKAIESEINKLNVSLGFGGTIDRAVRQPFQR